MDIHWTASIGDPTPAGWLTVFAYLVAAALCAATALATGAPADTREKERRLWLWSSAVMLALAINKQLDLQSLLTEVGRAAAKSEGWYENRRFVQAAFVGAIGIVGASGMSVLFWRLRSANQTVKLALAGLTITTLFVVARAASFHHVDIWLNTTMLGLRGDRVVELAAIGIVACAALYRIGQLWRASA